MAKDKFNQRTRDKFGYIENSYMNAGGHGYGSLPKVVIPFWTADGSTDFRDRRPKTTGVVKEVCEGKFGEDWANCLKSRYSNASGKERKCSVWCSTGVLDTYCCQYEDK